MHRAPCQAAMRSVQGTAERRLHSPGGGGGGGEQTHWLAQGREKEGRIPPKKEVSELLIQH